MSGSQHTHSWSKEFQKRRHAFEQRMEGDSVFEEEEEESQRRLRAIAAVKHNTEEGIGTRRLRSPPSGRDTPTHSSDGSSMNAQSRSISSPSPTWPTSGPFLTSPRNHHYSSVEVNFTSREPQRQRAPFDGNFEDEEDQLAPLGTSPGTFNRRALSSRRVVAIGEETGQKETVIPYCTETTSPAFSSQSQSDDSEREDSGLSAQIAILRNQNRHLLRQLREREEERDGLREQLETHQQEKSLFSPPPGLPSRVLDGRKVLREREEVKAEAVAILRARLPSSSGSNKALGSPRRKNFDELGDVERSSERESLAKIEGLKRENAELESRLREILEEKRRIEKELKHHQEAFVKVQEREQELLKDIEVLRDENSHHSGAISKLQAERESLQSENITLQDELTTASEKLNKTEKCYKEVEHENLALEAEIEQLMRDKKHLFEEKQKLQSAVEDARKTKENFRSTIRQLREQNLNLESQVGESTREHKAAVFKQEKVIKLRETKEQQTLREVMMLREERSQLKEKLVSAQQEIDSLEAQWKENQSTNQIQAKLSVSLSEVQMELAALRKSLKSTRRDVSSLPTKQHDIVQEQFMVLVQKSNETLAAVEHDKTKLSEAVELSETSLAKLDADFQQMKVENAKLLSQKGAISAEVSKLQSEVATLQDQKRLLEVQLVQNDSISHQQETKVQELEAQQKKLEEKLSSSERLWKNKFGRMEQEWEGKLAEANLMQENLSEEQESLLQEKASLEKQLSPLVQENEKLEIGKRELESQIESLQSKISEFSSKVRTNDSHISEAQRIIGRMIAKKACLVAEMRETKLEYEVKISASEQMYNKDIGSAAVENKELKESLAAAEKESQKVREQLDQISKKETGIGQMTSQLEAMTTENAQLKTEVKALEEKHQTAMKELQQLAEKEQTRHLHNEKLKMTLTTEISLLKSKLKSVEDDKTALEAKLMEFSKETASAFQAIPESKQVEKLRQQIVALQLTSRDQNAQFGDFNRSVVLETENKRLKDAARSSKDALEANTALRKQVSEMSRKIFFLESGTKTLTDQVHTLQNSLKVAREMKDRSTNERVKKLTEENQVLQDRVRDLEEDRTKKLMAADLKIVEAVKESDKLRQRLSSIRSSFEGQQRTNVEDIAKSLKTGSEVLHKMKASLSSSREDLKPLEANQQKVLALHSEIQHLLAGQTPHVASGRSATWSRGTSQTLPKVLQSLPPGYVSSLQGSTGFSQGRPSMTSPLHVSSFELQEKLSHLHAINSGLADRWKRHQVSLQERESEACVLEDRLSALKAKLERLAKENEELQESVTSVQDSELKPEQLQVISTLQKQIETLQDQVIDRDMALQDIELQMKKDYEMHDRNFASLKTQVLEFREQLSAKDNLIRTKDQYIQQTEERCLEYESQTCKAHKDLERALQEREQLIPENLQRSGLSNMSDVIRVQDEELRRLQKVLAEFSFEISQLQSQFDSMQREKSVLQSKAIEMERMHIQMKEGMSSEISYLRRLNLQLVEQQMKAEKAREILKEVKEAQETFKKQRETIKLEAECDSWKVKVHEQERKISDLEHQLDGQKVTIKILQAEKDHALLLTQHAQEQRPATSYLRPRSAEVARKPNYRISGIMKPRSTVSGQFPSVHETDFSIMLPVLNSSQGTKVDILNLEESHHAQAPLTLGPMVVTDDEAGYSGSTVRESEAKLSRPQRVQKLRNRGHRRTASTGSNINVNVLPPSSSVKEKDSVFSSNIPHMYPTKQKVPKHPSRPGSAGSTRPDITQILRIDSPEQITETAQAVSEYMSKLIDSHSPDLNDTSETVAETRENGDTKWTGGGESRKQSQGSVTGQPGQQGVKTKHPKYSEMTRSKPANKSTDSNGTTSSEGTSTSSHSDPTTKLSNDSANQTLTNDPTDRTNQKLEKPQILFRTESMSSTGSTFSLSGPGLPSRNPSFVYDGGESSTYSHESLEIGDSVENLQTFGRLGYYPYIVPIRGHHKHETTTSSSEDEREYWAGRRKRSSGTTVESSTPHRKDDNSNSSCDSDQLQRGGGYHANEEPAIPVHRTESISISDMEKCPTDVEMEDKVASLHKSFGRVRHSSTGSVKICYSESSNTSMEDVSKNL